MNVQTSERSFCIHLIAASPAASLVIPSIASLLGIEPSQAAARLSSLPTTLADRLPEPEARRLSDLLTLFGLMVRLDPVLSPPAGPRLDLAVRLASDAEFSGDHAFLADQLAIPASELSRRLAGVEGAVLRGVDPAQAEAIRKRLQQHKSMRVTVSNPAQAEHMLFCRTRRSPAWTEARRLGLAACRFTGASATQLDQATARHLERFAAPADSIVNRDFLRVDLLADVERELVGSDVMDFLATRPESRSRRTADGMLRIESDLGLTSAWQFARDYAAIGLTVRCRIRGQTR